HHEAVEERRLPDVRPPDDRDERDLAARSAGGRRVRLQLAAVLRTGAAHRPTILAGSGQKETPLRGVERGLGGCERYRPREGRGVRPVGGKGGSELRPTPSRGPARRHLASRALE